MKFSSVRDLRTKPAKVWKDLQKEREIILTNHGKPFALLLALEEGTLEDVLLEVRRALAKIAASKMRRIAQRKGLNRLSSKKIEEEIKEARKKLRAKGSR